MKRFIDAAAAILARVLVMSDEIIVGQITKPPRPEMGDLGYPCFQLAKELKSPPPKLAAELAENVATLRDNIASIPPELRSKLRDSFACFDKISAVGPYVNFVISSTALQNATVDKIRRSPENWGCGSEGRGKTVVIDFSSPNIAKPLGVHHIRSTMIGAALARVYAARGWKVVKVNHLGDWGTNFGQLMVSYKKAEAADPSNTANIDIHKLVKLYIEFHEENESSEADLDAEARDWFKRLEENDPEAMRLWELFVNESMKDLQALYQRLNVSFDYYQGESFYNNKMDRTISHIKEKNLLHEDAGAQVIDLSSIDEKLPPILIIKRDGATTYATRDLAAAEYRQENYHFWRSLYVVANQQELHFRQVFAALKLMGYAWADRCTHVKFGMLSFGPGMFGDEATTGSTRRGRVIFLEDVLDKAVTEARRLILENARDDDVKNNVDTISEQVGVGAVIFTEYLQRRQKDVVFTWDKALNLQGDSGPYLQYTYARLSSVLRKADYKLPPEVDLSMLNSSLERGVMLTLLDFPAAVERAVQENEPSLVADALLSLSADFNRMFTDKENHRLITDQLVQTNARLALVDSVRITLGQGLTLLGLALPEKM